jgi:hypothetical protein
MSGLSRLGFSLPLLLRRWDEAEGHAVLELHYLYEGSDASKLGSFEQGNVNRFQSGSSDAR